MRALGLVIAAALLAGCGSGEASPHRRKAAPKPAPQPAAAGLVLGEYPLARVVDGDTIHVKGLDSSLRLLGIDTEETFKHEAEKRAFEAGWPAYLKGVRGTSPRPVKFATPLGMEAKEFAEKWFAGVDKVRIERDHPAEIRDRYDRYLAYVFAQKDGVWLDYNVECVRAGMAPYFPKYGNSRRFHADFLAAEAEAKAAKRGIWAPGAMAYPDYDEREAWWKARADFIDAFRQEGAGKPGYIDLSHADATRQLEDLVGKEVVVLGVVGDVRAADKGPTRVMLSHERASDFPLIFFDREVYKRSGIERWKGEPVIVSGSPSLYENPHTHEKHVELVVDHASQLRLSPVPGLALPAVHR